MSPRVLIIFPGALGDLICLAPTIAAIAQRHRRAEIEAFAIDFLSSDLEGASRAISGIAEPKKFIAIFPGSGSPKKNWRIEKFCALADRLNEETGIVFIVGPAEDSLEDVLRAEGH